MQVRSQRPISRFSPAAFFLLALLLMVVFVLVPANGVRLEFLWLGGAACVVAGFAISARRAVERYQEAKRVRSLIAAVLYYGLIYLTAVIVMWNVPIWWMNWHMRDWIVSLHKDWIVSLH